MRKSLRVRSSISGMKSWTDEIIVSDLDILTFEVIIDVTNEVTRLFKTYIFIILYSLEI